MPAWRMGTQTELNLAATLPQADTTPRARLRPSRQCAGDTSHWTWASSFSVPVSTFQGGRWIGTDRRVETVAAANLEMGQEGGAHRPDLGGGGGREPGFPFAAV